MATLVVLNILFDNQIIAKVIHFIYCRLDCNYKIRSCNVSYIDIVLMITC